MMSFSAALETAVIPVKVRVLRSAVKVVQQSGRIVTFTSTSTTSYPPSQVKSKGKKFNNSPALSPELGRDRKVKTPQHPASLEDSPGPFNFRARLTRSSKVCGNTDLDWVFNYKYKKLYVTMNSWVPVLFNVEDFTRSQADLQVRVTAVVSDNLSSSTSSPPFHLIRLAEDSHSSYQQDSQGRHSVIFPISSTAATCRNIKFTRLSSDLGQEVKVVFSLEDGEELVGRRVFTVKIRAGPDNV